MATRIWIGTDTGNEGDWATAANWSGAAVPTDSDDVIFENSDQDVTEGFAQSAVTLASLTIKASYTGTIGTDASYLAIGATAVNIGQGEGDGSPKIKLNTGTVQTALTIYSTATATDDTLGAVQWKGTHADNVVTVQSGHLGVAMSGGEAATIATLNVGYTTNQSTDSTVWLGSGCTLTTINQTGGELVAQSNVTTFTQYGGTSSLEGTMTLGTGTIYGGTCYYRSNGTCTTLVVTGGGVVDYSRNARARTVTNADVYSGATVLDPWKTVTWTNGIDLNYIGLDDVALDIGKNFTLTPSAI